MCLEHPRGCSGSVKFAASLFTPAQGIMRYEDFGMPYRLELEMKDVILVLLQTSDQGFFQAYAVDSAELYLPWWVLSSELVLNEEAVIDLVLEPSVPPLGRNASPDAYEAAFRRMRDTRQREASVKDSWWSESHALPSGALQIRARLMLMSVPAEKTSMATLQEEASAPPLSPLPADRGACSPEPRHTLLTDALSPEDMRLLFQLQVLNSELRSALNLEEEELPQVESQTDEFVEQLRQVALEGHGLDSDLQSLEQELVKMTSKLTKAQLSKVDGQEGVKQHAERHEAAALRRPSADLVRQVQQVTRQSIELSSCYEDQIRGLEAELQAAIANQEPPQGTAPAWMLQQLQVLEADYDSLELVYAQAQEQRKQLENRVLHRLHMEQQSQSKDIGNLRDVIAQSKRNEPAPGLQPLKEEATRLRSEAEQLRLLRADEKARGEQQIAALRQEVHGLQEQCQRALARRSILESTLEDLKCSHSNFANTSREVIELQRDKAVMDKERVRMERRITILDEKIGSLQKEAEDIRLRASVVMGVMPEQAASCGDAEVWQLRDTLQQKQLQVQELRRKLARAEREEEESRLALETAKVDASILERKIRQLRSRSAHAQA